MKIGPKYKIARRLKAPIFEKTQTQKFALSEEKKSKNKREKAKSDFGLQLTEKQKARFFYGITEKQFKNYVKKVIEGKSNKGISPVSDLFASLETRLDNVVWKMGLARTHGAARQMVSHGHICVDGKRVYTPSYHLSEGQKITIREGSKNSPLFTREEERNTVPVWLTFDEVKKEGSVKSKPSLGDEKLMFDLGKVIEFYQR